MHVSVIRRLPPTLVGACGPVHDRLFDTFEAELDALELSGVAVDRTAADLETDDLLPVVTVNGSLLSRGRYPTHGEWIHAIGEAKRAELAHTA